MLCKYEVESKLRYFYQPAIFGHSSSSKHFLLDDNNNNSVWFASQALGRDREYLLPSKSNILLLLSSRLLDLWSLLEQIKGCYFCIVSLEQDKNSFHYFSLSLSLFHFGNQYFTAHIHRQTAHGYSNVTSSFPFKISGKQCPKVRNLGWLRTGYRRVV